MNYVVDFYCAKAKLAIEIDGKIHLNKNNKAYDNYRTRYLQSLGVNEIRITNNEIEIDINKVISKIKSNLPSPEVRRGELKG